MEELRRLAELVRKRNQKAGRISSIFRQPDQPEKVRERIASRVFGIEISSGPGEKVISGHFTEGKLAGNAVNIKWYARNDGRLSMQENPLPDFYLVLTGPKTGKEGSTAAISLWTLDYVYLFRTEVIMGQLRLRGAEPSETTRIRRRDWNRCELYPESRCSYLNLSDAQMEMLKLFSSDSVGA